LEWPIKKNGSILVGQADLDVFVSFEAATAVCLPVGIDLLVIGGGASVFLEATKGGCHGNFSGAASAGDG